MPMARYVKLNKLHEKAGMHYSGAPRLMQKKDIAAVYQLYKNQFDKLKFHFKFTQEELAQQLLPREGVVYTIVFENNEGKITDFVSFYNLPN
jgi:glycylpeptide N-tetradecanoyltransferase